ncbi:MAG: argininosuccinate lyase [Candidatus Cryptobacteroides sp.]|nr:argininosuccinate lyase [Bacteroidales bacterium]MDY3963051.1 argininosuccinate lyase [Candidatus Cryptobacteroides sp.]
MAKLWDKGYDDDSLIDRFTVGRDRELDLFLAPYDIMGTAAHIRMLAKVGLLPGEDLEKLLPELQSLYVDAKEGRFVIEPDVEDVHSQVELMLTRKLGDVGKKVHTGRSRNDQVLVDLKLYARARIAVTAGKARQLFDILQKRSCESRDVLLPGYTHLQVAMPSSFGLWFGAYAESLTDDMRMMKAAWEIVNQNPLGSAAGYGSSAPLDREMTTRLLGFDDLDYNSVYAQMCRGKMERAVSSAYASVAGTVGRLAMDCCLYASQNFGFIRLPDTMTTGSSIMPHKKNPDVFELVRAHCNHIQAIPNDISLVAGNLPSGYFRDMQLLKEIFIPMFDEMDDCLDIAAYAVGKMDIVKGIMDAPQYQPAFSVEEVNRLVGEENVPFRDAYRRVGLEIMEGRFEFHGRLNHTHAGSIGNLCNDRIKAKMDNILSGFGFEIVEKVENALFNSTF